MQHDEHRYDEQNISRSSLTDTIASRVGWARSVVSPWVRRRLDHTARTHGAGVSASHTLDRVQRVHHKAYETKAWRPDVGSVSPASLQKFAGTIMRRHQSFQAKATARISHPQSDQQTSSDLPLAYQGSVRATGETGQAPSPTSTPGLPSQSPGHQSTTPQTPTPSSSSESSSIPPLPSNHPLNTGDVPTKHVQRQTPPSTQADQSPPRPQQPPKRRRVYSRVEEITPGGTMTDRSDSSTEPAPPPEQAVQATDDSETLSEPPVGPDDAPASQGEQDGGPSVQRATREEAPSPSMQPKPADARSPTSSHDRDSQQPAPSARTSDTPTIQRATDDTEQTPPPATVQIDEDGGADEEPSALGEPGENLPTEDDATIATDRPAQDTPGSVAQPSFTSPQEQPAHVQREPMPESGGADRAQPAAAPDTRSKDAARRPHLSASDPEARSPTQVSDTTIQRRTHTSEPTESVRSTASIEADTDVSPKTVQSGTDHVDTSGDVDDTVTRASPAHESQQSSIQRTPHDASEAHVPADGQEGTVPQEHLSRTTPEPIEEQAEQGNIPESPVSHSKQASLESTSGNDVVQRTADTPAAQSAEPAVHPERSDRADSTDAGGPADPSITTSEESDVHVSDSAEAEELSAPEQAIQDTTSDKAHLQRAPERDTGAETANEPDPAKTSRESTEVKERNRPEQPATDDVRSSATSLPAKDNLKQPSTGPETPTQTEPASNEAPTVQKKVEGDAKTPTTTESTLPERKPVPPLESDTGTQAQSERQDAAASHDVPASMQRAPDLRDERADVKANQDDAVTTEISDEQSVPHPEEAQITTEPPPTQHDSDQSVRTVEPSQEHPSLSIDPSHQTTIQRSPERDRSHETAVQREPEAPPAGPDRLASEQPAATETEDDNVPVDTSDETTPAVPTQQTAADEQMPSAPRDLPQAADDVSPPHATPTDQHEYVEPTRHTAESSPQRATVQRMQDESARAPRNDVASEQITATEPEPAPSPEQEDTSPPETPASDETTPAVQPSPSGVEEQPDPARPRDIQSSDTQSRTQVQREPDKVSEMPPIDSDAAHESDAVSEPASPSQRDMLQQERAASDEARPTAQQPESGEQPNATPAHDGQSTRPQPRTRVQREPEDADAPSATDSGVSLSGRSTDSPPPGDTTPRARLQRRPDDAGSTVTSNTMPLPRTPVEPDRSDTPGVGTTLRESDRDISTSRSVDTAPARETHIEHPSPPADGSTTPSEPAGGQGRTLQRDDTRSVSVRAVDVAQDTQYATRKVSAPDRSQRSGETAGGRLEQALLSRAESHSRLPLAARHTIRRKSISRSDDPGISQPTQTLRRVRTQIQARRPRAGETTEQSAEHRQDTQLQPADRQTHTQMSEAQQVQSTPSIESPARSDMQPAPQVAPPVFTAATDGPHTTLIQRTPLEFVQRTSPLAGSEARQEPASETTSASTVEEHDDHEEINLDRLAREVYPLIKRLIAIERERRPGR